MRKIINLSLSQGMAELVEKFVEEGNYVSKSEFFRHLLRMWIEGKIQKELAESRQELSSGRGRLLKSLKELR